MAAHQKSQQWLHFFSDREKLQEFARHNKEQLQHWGVFTVLVLMVFLGISDKDFSFILTFASMVSMFSFMMVVHHIHEKQSCAGVSMKMLECYILVSGARLCSILPFEGYLPFDKTGDWFYKLVEIAIAALCSFAVYLCRARFAETYQEALDSGISHVALIAACLFFALLFHPTLNQYFISDVAWAFALYLEAVAALPQLFMFQRERRVEPVTTHFLAGQVVAKALSFTFWCFSFQELNEELEAAAPWQKYVGNWVILTQLFQLLLMGDFMYHYVQCLRKGVSMENLLSVVDTV